MHINWNLGLQQFALPFPSSSSYIPSRRVITFNSILSCSFCFLSLSWLSLYSSAGIAGSAAARFYYLQLMVQLTERVFIFLL